DQPGPADLHDQRRGPGPGVRLAEVRGPRPGGSARAGRPRHRHRRGAERRRAGQREQADRDALRPAPVVRRPGHRPAPRRRPLGLPIALVVMVIFLFLRNVSATIIPSLAVPMSLVGTFAVMYALGYTIDIISLMALTLSVGFVVDDAVVVLENIVRHMEGGMPRTAAALKGSKEMAFPILSMT